MSTSSPPTCPMCGATLREGRQNCSQCGENLRATVQQKPRTTNIDILLAVCFGFAAITFTANACLMIYFSCLHQLNDGPRASEFDAELTQTQRILLFFDVCQTPLIRGSIGIGWLWAFPGVGWVIQSFRERRGAALMSRFRIFWFMECMMIFVTALLGLLIVFGSSDR